MIVGQVVGWRKLRVRHIDGDSWLLEQDHDNPLRFITACGVHTLTPPDKFIHDFGSIPGIAQLVMGGKAGHPDFAQHAGKVYPLHDWAYEHQKWDDGTPMTRRDADQLLRAALECVHCEDWYCGVVYAALRIGGRSHWRKHTNGTILTSTYGGYPWRKNGG